MGNSENMSPDSPSTLFPDRPIRPLPKRRLRERLSPDVADSIQYPPAPQNTAPLFAYPYNNKDDLTSLASDPLNAAHRENSAALGQEASQRRNGLGTDQDDYSILGQARRTFVSRPIHDATGAIRTPLRQAQARQSNPQQPPSTASSVDGYDSFENSNNKKKRKIPTAGETILNGTHVLNELGALGVSSPIATGDEGSLDPSGTTSAAYYQSGGTGTSGQGISGPGRGRYGRVRSGRSPLRTLSDPNSSWGSRISNKLRPGGIQYPPQPAGENSGIISTAIASAEKLPIPAGQENISLLHQETPTKPSPSSSQFTFTFDSQNPVSWPGSDPAPPKIPSSNYVHQPSSATDYRDQYSGLGTRSAQSQNGLAPPTMGSGGLRPMARDAGDGNTKGTGQANAAPKKPKKRGNSLTQAAKQRRRETEIQNAQHPPAPEDTWMCEFCEYERIFGRPPEALIRQYEIKDRRRRREEAERRRLLEKAKMKSRKGKKASKAPAKTGSGAPGGQAGSSTAQQAPPPPPGPEDDQALNRGEIDEDEDGYDPEVHYGDHSSDTGLPGLVPDLSGIRDGGTAAITCTSH